MTSRFKTLYLVMWIPVGSDREDSNYVHASENGYDYRTTINFARDFGSPERALEYVRVHNSANDEPSKLIHVIVDAYYGRNIPYEPAIAGKEKPRGPSQGHRNEQSAEQRRRRSDHDND